MDSEYTDNPAGRLWLFMSHVATRATTKGPNNSPTFREIFTEYFGEEITDADYFSKIAAVMRLPVDTRQQVLSLGWTPIPRDMLLRALPTVQSFLASHADGRHTSYGNIDSITDGVLNDLQMCSHILSNSARTPNPTEEQRKEVRAAVSELISVLLDDQDLPVEIRRVMLRYAHKILVALDEYALRGPEAIAEANDALKGFTLANAAAVKPSVDIWDKFTRASTIATLAVTLVTGPAQIGQSVAAYTEYISGPTPIIEAPGEPIDLEEVIEATIDDDPTEHETAKA